MSQTAPADANPFRLLAHPYRRQLLAALADTDGSVTVRDVRNEIVTRETAASLPDVPAAETKRVYLTLLHIHVPMLADAGVIDYDSDRDVIEAADLEAVRPLLSVATDDRPPSMSAQNSE